MLRHSLMIAVAFAWSAQATARPAPQVARQIGALQACKATSDNIARLACFDREVASLLAATQSQDVVIVERGEVRKARKGLFGFSLPNLGFLTGRDDNDGASHYRCAFDADGCTSYGGDGRACAERIHGGERGPGAGEAERADHDAGLFGFPVR